MIYRLVPFNLSRKARPEENRITVFTHIMLNRKQRKTLATFSVRTFDTP